MTATFHPDGSATMFTEDDSVIPPQAIGHITRAARISWIDFNEHRQVWEVRLDPHADNPVFSDPSYEACRAWEARHFDSVLS